MSHELRSPLTRLTISLALARNKTSETLAEHDRIEREVQRLDQLIGQIIHFSRIQNGADKASLQNLSLKHLVEQLVEDGDFEAQARNRAVIATKLDDVRVAAVPELLGSAIENTIRNAIRFTPDDTNVEVSLEKASKHQVVVKIRDYGPGVPEEALKELFEPFFRVDDTRGKENDGTGLGMAIASAAVKLHDGTISAANAKPGLEVTIRIPLKML